MIIKILFSIIIKPPATISVIGAGILNVTRDAVYSNEIHTGTATDCYAFGGDTNHIGSSDSKDFDIGKAVSVIAVTITGATFVFNGSVIELAILTVT